MVKRWCPTEHEEAKTLMRLVKLHETANPLLENLFAIPNGGARNKIVAAKLKAEGVKAGVLDYMLAVPVSPHVGLFVELKRMYDSAPSPEQRDWIKRLSAVGYRCEVAKGGIEAWKIIADYLGIRSVIT
jgi:hypothetical protein